MSRIVVGICGYKGSGKTAVAKAFCSVGYTRIRFAEGLKTMLKVLGLTDAHTDGELKEVPCERLGGKTPRYAMQTLGTEWGRDLIWNQLWINDWIRRVNETPKDVPVVVDDLRFPNEQTIIENFGGQVVWVERPSIRRSSAHASEDLAHIIPAHEIHNVGSLGDLTAMAGKLGTLLKCHT